MKSSKGLISFGVLIGTCVLFALVVIGIFSCFSMHTIPGNKVGVRETFSGGVEPASLPAKTYWLNRWTEDIYDYDLSGQVLASTLEVKSSDSQQVHLNVTVRWRRDPAHVVEQHKSYREDVAGKLLLPEVIRVAQAHATVRPAIELYSGETFNKLRLEVEDELRKKDGELFLKGVLVDSFVIAKPEFPNKQYVENIEARQLAIIKESRAKEEQKANLAMAEAAKAAALKEQYESVVRAETEKQTAILKQQAESEQAIIKAKADAANAIVTQEAESKKVILAADAEAKRNIAISDAQRQAEINRAAGIKAVGEAEAEKNKLLLTSFSAPGSDLYAKVEIAKSLSAGLVNVRGYLPQNVTYNTIADNFDKGVSLLVGQPTK